MKIISLVIPLIGIVASVLLTNLAPAEHQDYLIEIAGLAAIALGVWTTHKRVLHLLRWGLVPHWAEPKLGAKMSNARGETVTEKPSFRSAYKARRCLIPASGFYEWKTVAGAKQPFYISLRSGKPMAFAGLWESKNVPEGVLETACIITTSANEIMAPIHDRMPVIVSPENWQDWLSAPVGEIGGLVVPFSADEMQAWPVSKRVSRSSEEGVDLIEPFEHN